MLNVGVLTCFGGSDSAYSLVNVVATQLKMLLAGGYRPVLFVKPGFTGSGVWADPRIEVRHVTPDQLSVDGLDVVLCHDVVFLTQNADYGAAVRRLAQSSSVVWLHWQHSRGDSAVEPCANSWYCYPNRGDLGHVAQLNGAALERVVYVPHPLDFDYLGWPDLAIRIAEDLSFPFVDVSGILPTRLDRQKQVEKAVRLYAGVKRAGRSVCFLVADAYATGERFIEYRKDVTAIARELGLSDREVVFLSEWYSECNLRTPREVIKALLEMSNVFVQPSNAETSSLVAMEAALAGNLIVINADFPPIAHLYKKALSMPFGSVFHDTQYYRNMKTADGREIKVPDPQAFWNDQARDILLPALDGQLTLAVKRQQLRERWPSRVFNDHLEPAMVKAYQIMRPFVEVTRPEARGDPEVTAIITTIDNLPLLKRQVPILLNECGRVIVVNNGAEDGTREWLALHPEVTATHRQNLGAGPGRNAGLAEWDKSPTPYTLMIDGGILPPLGGVAKMKAYLDRHPDVHVISPEVMRYTDGSCFVTDEAKAVPVAFDIPDNATFRQCSLSGSAYELCRASAWAVRFSEEGPFGEPGWGCDDNDMQFRWNEANIIHRDFQLSVGWRIYRRSSGSFARLFRETGIWPNQYGSVYEKRNVKLTQDWRRYYDPTWHKHGDIQCSFVVETLQYPALAAAVKDFHDEHKDISHEVIVNLNGEAHDNTRLWLDMFALRWPWGNVTINPTTNMKIERTEQLEPIWTGDVIINRPPRGKEVIRV